MLRLFFILLISLSSLFLSAQNRPPFRVVFWNTENFFDTRHDSLKNDMEFLPHSMRHWNHRRYKKKLDNVARTLTAIGEWNFPALIGLCEVENDTVMRDLTLYSPLKEAGYRYVMTHCSDLRGIDVALLYPTLPSPSEISKVIARQEIFCTSADYCSQAIRWT